MWSPRQLAELAGTSRRTVRYYDEIGLLPKPIREANGYGRYGVDHLIRLLRIRRLTELGLTLPQISVVGDADHPPEHMMRGLDSDLAEQIERMQRVRVDLSVMLTQPGPFDLPVEVEQQLASLPPAGRSLIVVLSRLLDAPAFAACVALSGPFWHSSAVDALDRLAPDAEPFLRADTAERLARHLRDLTSQYPDEAGIIADALRGGVPPRQHTVDEAIDQLYNCAQLDVLARVRAVSHEAHRGCIHAQPDRQLAGSY